MLLAGRTSGVAPELDVAFFNYTRLYTTFGGGAATAEFKHLIVTTTAGDWRETAEVATGYTAARPTSPSPRQAQSSERCRTQAPVTPAHASVKSLGIRAMLDPSARALVSPGRAVPTHRDLQALLLYGMQFVLAPVAPGSTMRPPAAGRIVAAYAPLFKELVGAEWFFAPYAAIVNHDYDTDAAHANVFSVGGQKYVVPVVWGAGSNTSGPFQPPGRLAKVSIQQGFNWKVKVEAIYPGGLPPVELNYTLPNGPPGATQVDVADVELRHGCTLLVVTGCMVGQC